MSDSDFSQFLIATFSLGMNASKFTSARKNLATALFSISFATSNASGKYEYLLFFATNASFDCHSYGEFTTIDPHKNSWRRASRAQFSMLCLALSISVM